MDKKDRRILYELDRNSRRSYSAIAKIVGLKKEVVAYRVHQMEKAGIIYGYYTLIDFSAMGYSIVRVYLKLKNTTPEVENGILDHLTKEKNALTIYKTEIRWDIVCAFLVKRPKDFTEIEERLKVKFGPYILEGKTSILYEYVQFYRNDLVDKDKRDYTRLVTGSSEKLDIEGTDIKLLSILSDNARKPLVDIANDLKMTPMAVKYRLKRFGKKKIVLAYRAMINYTALGYEYYKVDLILESPLIKDSLEEFIKKNSNLIYINKVLGGNDFEFDIEIKNLSELYSLIEKIKTRFKGLLRTFEFYKATKILKYVYMPKN